jgi:hypothetical protein
VSKVHSQRYQQLRQELVPRIHAKIAAECEDTARFAGQVEREMLVKLAKDFEQLAPRDQAGAIRNVSTVKAINVDKAALLRGQPTEIVEHRQGADELWAELEAMFPSVVNVEVVPGAGSGAGLVLEAGSEESDESTP